MSSFVAILLCAVFGILVGMAAGLLGIGGGGLISPFLRIVMGVPGLVATATSLMAIIPTAISGTLGHMRTRTINLRMGLLLGLTGCLCSP
ncbi:MAG: TSUP family transporter, partial [Coriobacteriales bacterium]|nr:TSUP family transporter [Coriobacteriales bacterium]